MRRREFGPVSGSASSHVGGSVSPVETFDPVIEVSISDPVSVGVTEPVVTVTVPEFVRPVIVSGACTSEAVVANSAIESTPSVMVLPSEDFALMTTREYDELASSRSVSVIIACVLSDSSRTTDKTSIVSESFVRMIRTRTASSESISEKESAIFLSSITVTFETEKFAAWAGRDGTEAKNATSKSKKEIRFCIKKEVRTKPQVLYSESGGIATK